MLGAPGGSVHRLLRVLTWLLRPRSWWSQGAGVRPAVSPACEGCQTEESFQTVSRTPFYT